MCDPEDRFKLCAQRKTFLAEGGHQLVLGGPGSGKTTIGLLKARRTVLAGLKHGQSVLFLSFSNAATKRIMSGAADLIEAEVEQHLEIKTYHSLAWEILRAHGYLLSGKRLLTIVPSQDADILKAGLSNDEWAAEQERLFQDEGQVTYDQFAPRAAEIIRRSPQLRDLYADSYPLILVDEFQDTDEDQWGLLRSLAEKSEVIALGDEGQRIYDWRPGVSPYRLDQYKEELAPGVFDFGTENNRSPTTDISNFGRALLDPEEELPWGDDVKKLTYPRQFLSVAIKSGARMALGNARDRSGNTNISIAVAARGKLLVRLISDALDNVHNWRGKVLGSIPHDVLIDQTQVMLAARVTAFLLEAPTMSPQDGLAHALIR
ncbi:MAG: hypothetical protein COB59_03580 [Rhodospirillaceae bacterium]|nr:MAG: hypothetical protein COB59_03580 [Rhodospirillaceae bacterium]